MRVALLLLSLSVSLTSAATEVLPTVAFAEVALRAARLAPRALSLESARDARDMFDKASAHGTWRRATFTDVAEKQAVEDGVLTMIDDASAKSRANATVFAREFTGEAEIRAALGGVFMHLNDFGNSYLDALNRRYPPARATEWLRLSTWPTATMLIAALGTPSLETLAAQVPLALTGIYRNELRVRARREARAGVPHLPRHLNIITHALRDSTDGRRAGLHRVFTMLRARAFVSSEVHQILFDEHQSLSARNFDRLIEAGRHVTTRWTDAEPGVDETHEIVVESVLYSRADVQDPSLHWILSYAAVPRARAAGGLAAPATCRGALEPRASR